MTDSRRPRLIVCTTCRAGRALAEGETPPGALLHAALQTAPDIELREVACLANCDQGCSAAIASPGKWTYLLGHLTPDLAADLLHYAASYAGSATGTVLPSRRPASLRRMIIGRVPYLEPFA